MRLIILLSLFISLPTLAAPPVLTLEDAWRESHRQNDDILAARANLDRVRAMRSKVFSAMMPKLSASGTYTLNHDEVKVGDRTVLHKHDYTARGQVDMPLLDLRAYPFYQSASQRVDAERDRLTHLEQGLMLEVATTYYATLAAKRLLAVATKSVAARQLHAEATEARKLAGHAVELDLHRARAALYRAHKEQIDAEREHEKMRDILAIAIGRTPPLKVALVAPELVSEPVSEESVEVANATEKRFDLSAAQADLEIAERNKLATWLGFLPKVSVVGTIDLKKEGFSNPDGGYVSTLRVNLLWNLFDGGSRYAQLQEDEAVIKQTRAILRKHERTLSREVRASMREIRSGKLAVKAAGQALSAASKALAAAQAGFKLGKATGLDVLEAEESHVSAAVTRVREDFQLQLAQLTLKRASGGLAIRK